jgi:hypothetical protein
MLPVYGGKCLSRKAVQNLVEKFSEGHSNVADDSRPGRLETATEATVQRVELLIRADRRITIDSVATALGCSQGVAYSTMHDRLKFRKVCARCVLKELTDREKIKRMDLSLKQLLRYADEGEDMLNSIVTRDESWMHHHQPESKRPAKETSQFNCNKCLMLRYQLGRLCLLCFGILREYC